MKRLLIIFTVFLLLGNAAFAAKLPDGVQNVLKKTFPSVDIRFDGVIILPDGTIYLPLYPAKIKEKQAVSVVSTIPEKTSLNKKPDVVIFDNDFVLLKVLTNKNGSRTVLNMDKPPLVVKTGLLPQDMLVPKNLIIPENLKGILGALNVKIEKKDEIKVAPQTINYDKVLTIKNIKPINSKACISQLKDKILYISTTYSKDIQVVKGENNSAEYALELSMIPCSLGITPDSKFLLATTYNSPLVNVISIADDRIIKKIDLTDNANEIVIDKKNNIAYITAPMNSTIYQVSLADMTLKKKIKVNGYCEHLNITDNYLFYVDKMTNKIWSIEFDNDYSLRDMGEYPNISSLAYSNGFLFLISRTKNRVAVVDYKNQTLFTEFKTVEKPIDMLLYGNSIFVLGAKDNVIQVIDKNACEPTCNISLNTIGFATGMRIIPNSHFAIVYDTKSGKYSILDMVKKNIIKTNSLDLPIKQLVIGKNIRKL